jgi:hypothetical protein
MCCRLLQSYDRRICRTLNLLSNSWNFPGLFRRSQVSKNLCNHEGQQAFDEDD